MHKLALALTFLLCLSHVQAQNIEGQIVASQYGTYRVPGSTIGGFQFPVATCQVSGGGKNFSAFQVNVPVKIVDGNPALTEIATPSSVFISQCSINMSTTYVHQPPYYLTSGTGGLQEAINANMQNNGINSIILDWQWYRQVVPGTPATVIANVKGITQLTLTDVTTAPYTWYRWNGTQYVVVPVGGSGAVSSVFTRVGDVVAASGDYTCSQVTGCLPSFAWRSNLTATQQPTDTTLSVASIPAGLTAPATFYVDGEYETFSGINFGASQLTGITRGVSQTTAATHANGTNAYSVTRTFGPFTQTPRGGVFGGLSDSASLLATNCGTPAPIIDSGASTVFQANCGSAATTIDSAGRIHQSALGSIANFMSPIYIGNLAVDSVANIGQPIPISNTTNVAQTNGAYEFGFPMGFAGPIYGQVKVTPVANLPAPVLNGPGGGTCSITYEIVGTDPDGATIPGATATINSLQSFGSGGAVAIQAQLSAGIVSYVPYRTATSGCGVATGKFTSAMTSAYPFFTDTGQTGDGTTPPGANTSVAKSCVGSVANPELYCTLAGATSTPPLACSAATAGWTFYNTTAAAAPYEQHCYSGSSSWSPITPGGGGGGVTTVFARGGAVTAQSGDYTVGQVTGAAPLASPALTGTPSAPTQTTGDNTIALATDQFVQTALLTIPNGSIATTQSTGDNTRKVATDAFVQTALTGFAPGVTPLSFGGFGDAVQIINGCNTTASSTSVTCPNGSFLTADTGKAIWFSGAGTSGVAKGTTIAGVVSGTSIIVASAPALTVSNAPTVYGHDDSTALQACWNYSGTNGVSCIMNSMFGYLIGNAGLTISNHMNVTGGGFTKFVTQVGIYCEFNGDCLSLAAGPDVGVNLSNLQITADATQPNSRGIHLNAATGAGQTFGGLFNSTLNNVEVDSAAQECLWLDGGGGASYTGNLPNQYINFFQFNCNGPVQQHNANMILATGQNAQIIFLNGAVNGISQAYANLTQLALWQSFYPNPLIEIKNKTVAMNDSPEDIKFIGYTSELGTIALDVTTSNNIHFENGYMENVLSPITASFSSGLTLNGNHIVNSGTATGVLQATNQVNGSFRDNFMATSAGFTIAALAVCSNSNNTIDFVGNTSPVYSTSGCATAQDSNTATLTVTGGQTVFMNGSGTSITTITAPLVAPGKTVTLYAGGQFTLTTGGNINFANIPSPLVVPTGGSVTLQLFDLGPTWLITSTTAGIATLNATTQTYSGAGLHTSSTGADNYGPSGSSYTSIYDDGNFHVDASTNTARFMVFSGNSGSLIAAFRASAGGSNLITFGNTGKLTAQQFAAGGATFSVSGCGTATSLVGGSTAGRFTGGSATCTPVVTMGASQAAPNGWMCSVSDFTTATAAFRQSTTSTTTATFTAGGTVGATDVISFACTAY